MSAKHAHNEPLIIPRAEHRVSRKNISPEALKVLYRLNQRGFRGYLAGGGVRDLLLQRKPKDFDIVTDATPNRMKKLFRNCRLIGRRFRLAHVFFGEKIIEVATFRANVAAAPAPNKSARPAGKHTTHVKRDDGLIVRDNVYGTPEEDAVRRDFTVNAMFYNIDGFSLIDYVGGLEDLRHKLIRSIGDPRVRYKEDPVRMIRAIRFAATLDFTIEKKSYNAIRKLRTHLAEASNARLYEEALKLFLCGAAEKAYAYLNETDLFEVMFPQLGKWLKKSATKEDHAQITAGFRWIDGEIGQHRTVDPALLFSLFFGGYLEAMAADMRAKGMRPSEAISVATMNHISELAERIVVPKKVGYEIAHILSSQPRFQKTRGKQPARFASRRYFRNALAYFMFLSSQGGTDSDVVKFWKKIKPPPVRETEKRRRRRRPRRSRPRNAPARAAHKRPASP